MSKPKTPKTPKTPKSTPSVAAPSRESYFDNLPIEKLTWHHDRNIGKGAHTSDNDTTHADFDALVESVKAHGVETPIVAKEVVDENGNVTGYTVLAGRRRCEASKEAGKTTVPAFIKPHDWQGNEAGLALRENTLRRDISPREKILAIKAIMASGVKTGKGMVAEIGGSEKGADNLMRVARKLKQAALDHPGATLKKLIAAASFETEAEQLAFLKGEVKPGSQGNAQPGGTPEASGDASADSTPAGEPGGAVAMNNEIESALKRVEKAHPAMVAHFRTVRSHLIGVEPTKAFLTLLLSVADNLPGVEPRAITPEAVDDATPAPPVDPEVCEASLDSPAPERGPCRFW